MINLTDAAREEISSFFANQKKTPLRVYFWDGGCHCSSRLAVKQDEPGPKDATCEVDGITFCMDKTLLAETGGVTVDLIHSGLTAIAKNPDYVLCSCKIGSGLAH